MDACGALASSDVDGAANGTYAPASVPFTPQDESGMVVELDPDPAAGARARGNTMRTLARFALRAVTGLGTVFIAACYGVRYAGQLRSGVVVDSQSGARIHGILVSCLGDGGSALEQDVTDAQGEFAMRADCVEYRAEDVDGAQNGSYAAKTASFPGTEPVVIPMDPVP